MKRYIDIPQEEAFTKVVQNVHLLLNSGGISTRIRINFLKRNIEQGMKVFDFLKEEFKYDSHIVILYWPQIKPSKKRFNFAV